AVSNETELQRSRSVGQRRGDPYRAHRFLRRAAARTSDAGNRYPDRRIEPRPGTLGHLPRHGLAYRTMRLECRLRDTEEITLHLVCVRDDAAKNDVARPGNRCKPRAKKTAGATLGDGYRELKSSTAIQHNSGHV